MTGYSIYSSVHPDSQLVDLHAVMTFDADFTLTCADTFIFWVEVVTHKDGDINDFLAEVDSSKQWFERHIHKPCCCKNRGNVDGLIGPAGPIDISDLTYLVAYMFGGGLPPPCPEQGNVDGLVGPAGPIDISDLTYLIAYMFGGGPPPPQC